MNFLIGVNMANYRLPSMSCMKAESSRKVIHPFSLILGKDPIFDRKSVLEFLNMRTSWKSFSNSSNAAATVLYHVAVNPVLGH